MATSIKLNQIKQDGATTNQGLKFNGSTWVPASVFLQGGNSFGTAAVLGTNDSNTLDFYTNGVKRGNFSTTGAFILGTSSTLSITNTIMQMNAAYNIIPISSLSVSGAGQITIQTTNTNGVGFATSTYSSDLSGTRTGAYSSGIWSPAAGTAVYNSFTIKPTINTSGTGNTRSLYINPTLSGLNGTTHYALEIAVNNSSARGIYQTGSSTINNIVGSTTIGSTSTPNASSLIDMISTSKGFGLPSMTSTERDAISSPRTGLLVYNNTDNAPSYYDGSSWVDLGTGGSGSDGNGIYDGSGTIAASTIATLPTGDLFSISYPTATSALLFDDSATYSIQLRAKDVGTGLIIGNDDVQAFTDAGSFFRINGTDIEINSTGTLQLSTSAGTGTAGQVLTSDGTYATWQDASTDGNGIYDGSGSIPASTVATLGGLFTFAYSSGSRAIRMSNSSGYVRIYGDESNTTHINASAGSIYADTTDQFDVKVGGVQRLVVSDTSGFSGWNSPNTLSLYAITDFTIAGDTSLELISPYVGIKDPTNAGELRIYDSISSGSNYISFTVPTLTSNYNYVLPEDYGTAGYVLTTDGAGTLTWAAGGGGADGNGIYSGSGTIPDSSTATLDSAATFGFSWSNTNDALIFYDSSGTIILYDNNNINQVYLDTTQVILSTSGASITLDSSTIELTTGSTGFYSSGSLTSTTSPYFAVYNDTASTGGTLRFQEGTTNGANYVEFKAPNSLSANSSYTWPTASSTGLLHNSGGTLSWSTASNSDLASGVGGIYKGNGIVNGTVIALLSSGGTLNFNYSDSSSGLTIDDVTGISSLSPDNNTYLSIVDNAVTVSAATGSSILVVTDIYSSMSTGSTGITFSGTETQIAGPTAISTGTSPSIDAAAILQLESTSKGLLVPRMTTTQKNAVSTPPDGLVVYDTDTDALNIRAAGAWVGLGSGGGGLSDGDYGDIVVSSSGTVLTIDSAAVSNSKLASGSGGIYKGNGTITGTTVGTLAASGTLFFAYSGGNNGFGISDTSNSAFVSGQSGNYAVYADNSNSGLTGPSSSSWLMDSTFALTGTASVSNTTTAADRLIIQTNSSGTAAAGFGGSILFQGESSTTNNRDMARLAARWVTATDASRAAKLAVDLGNSGGSLTEIAYFSAASNSAGELYIGSAAPAAYSRGGISPQTSFTVGGNSQTITISSSSATANLGVALYATSNTTTSTGNITIGSAASFTQTSGTRDYVNYTSGFAPTSGTAVHNQFTFSGTFNQTGGANGITRGIYLNQTLTAVADMRLIEIAANNSNAKGVYQTGSSTTNNFVGGTTFGSTTAPNAAAAIDVISTTKGIKLPVMTNTQRDAISSPPEGLVVYSSDNDSINLYDGSSIWKRMSTKRTILKTADETVNNSSTFQADDALTFTAKANKKYVVTYHLFLNDTDWLNGMKGRIVASGATTVRASSVFYQDTDTRTQNYDQSGGAGYFFWSAPSSHVSNIASVTIQAYVNPGASDRTVNLEWAQDTAGVRDSVIKEGSWMEYEEIN